MIRETRCGIGATTSLSSRPEGSVIKKYVAVYLGLLVLTVLHVIGYQNIDGSQLLVRFLTFAPIEAILAVLFWMNLGAEIRPRLVTWRPHT